MKRAASELPSALGAIREIGVITGAGPAIFLDYDGTLTPIVPDPNAALIGGRERSVLMMLAQRVPVGIVSGRNLDDLRTLVAVDDLIYSGNHGWEIESPEIGSYHHPLRESLQRELDEAQSLLEEDTRHLAGVVTERKRFAIAVHTRRVGSDSIREAAVALAVRTARRFEGLRLTIGKEIAELRPAVAWDKGTALGFVLDSLAPARIPIYIGDDQTDEDAFVEAARRQGIGVVVGCPAQTKASYRLADPSEVLDFLQALGGETPKTNRVS